MQSELVCKPIISPALEGRFLCVSYYLSVNISDALGTMLED